jgi:hypothetical protein
MRDDVSRLLDLDELVKRWAIRTIWKLVNDLLCVHGADVPPLLG